jgi:hypothetical protein
VHYLAPDGYFVQWMQVYETNTGVLASVMKALAPHFGAYALYNTDDLDILIVATRAAALPLPDDRLLQSPQLRDELARVGVQSVADIELRKIGDNLTIGPLLQSIPVPPNSDFYPFVDLNAPRLRYMRQNALELPALTLLPIPFLELLDSSTSRAATVEPSPDSPIVRDRLVRRALEIRTAVSTGSLNNLDPLSALYLSHIDLSAERCADKAGQKTWSDALRNISDETAAYLNAAELQELWSKVRTSPCYRVMSGNERAWADLLAAISQRSAPEIVRFGTELIGPQTPDSEDQLAYLTTVTAAAYVHLGQIAEARSLLHAQLGRIRHSGQFDLALRDLAALTR